MMKQIIYIALLMVMAHGLTAAPAKSWAYAYNDTGARKQVVEDGELTDDVINIAGQVISRTGLPENSYAYDNDGNLESDPNWDYIFNEANQLVRMDNKEAVGYTVTFSYDFSGRRYEKSVLLEDVLTERTTYVYDGQRVIAEIDSLEENVEDHELEKTYTWGLYIDELLAYTDHSDPLLPETYYVTTDRQFSVRTVVDSQGNIVEERNYDPFGKDYNDVAETSDLAYGFTGRRYDAESDLYYFRARYYSTDLGSFISRDPLEYVDGMNMYSGYFAFGFAMDPSGQKSGSFKFKKGIAYFKHEDTSLDTVLGFGVTFVPNDKCVCENIDVIQVVTENYYIASDGKKYGYYPDETVPKTFNKINGIDSNNDFIQNPTKHVPFVDGEYDTIAHPTPYYIGKNKKGGYVEWNSKYKDIGNERTGKKTKSANRQLDFWDAPSNKREFLHTSAIKFELAILCVETKEVLGVIKWGISWKHQKPTADKVKGFNSTSEDWKKAVEKWNSGVKNFPAGLSH